MRDHATVFDWERLLETVRIEEAQVGVYYSLRFLDQLLGVRVPGDVLAALRPDPLWAHYLLHPLKLAYHLTEELLKVPASRLTARP